MPKVAELPELEAKYLDYSFLAITEGLHAGVEPTGREIIDGLSDDPVPGVFAIRGIYPDATRAGRRFLASGELGGHFTEYVRTADLSKLDKDQLAARSFMTTPLPHFWLGIDPHDSPNSNANYLVVGHELTYRSLGVAAIMKLNEVVIEPNYPFFIHYPEFVSVETERAPATNPLSQSGFWRECLAKMVVLGPGGMDEAGREACRDLKYYLKADILRTTGGVPNPHAVERIKQLEGIAPPGPYFTPFESLPSVLAHRLQQFSGRVCIGSWDDNNHSPEMPSLGLRADGRPRRLAFGSLLLEVDPPIISQRAVAL